MFEHFMSVISTSPYFLVGVILLIGAVYITEAYKKLPIIQWRRFNKTTCFTIDASKHFYVNGVMVKFIECDSFIDVTQIVFMELNVDSAPNYGISIKMKSGAVCLIEISSPQTYFEFGNYVTEVRNKIYRYYN